MCSKGKSKTVVNIFTSTSLTISALNKLPRRQEIRPEDCLEMIGKKRQRELMEDELSRFPKNHHNQSESESESEESKHDHPKKRKKTSGPWSFSTTPTQTASTKHVLVVSHTDVGAI